MTYYQPASLVRGGLGHTAFLQDHSQDVRPVTRMSSLECLIVVIVAATHFTCLNGLVDIVSESGDLQCLSGLGIEP